MFVAALESSDEAMLAMEKEKLELNLSCLEQEKKKDSLTKEEREKKREEKK